jgi:hypothetical protein
MTKAIRSYPVSKQAEVISRRLRGQSRGIGYLSAKDAQKHINPSIAVAIGKIKEAQSNESAFIQDMEEANPNE